MPIQKSKTKKKAGDEGEPLFPSPTRSTRNTSPNKGTRSPQKSVDGSPSRKLRSPRSVAIGSSADEEPVVYASPGATVAAAGKKRGRAKKSESEGMNGNSSPGAAAPKAKRVTAARKKKQDQAEADAAVAAMEAEVRDDEVNRQMEVIEEQIVVEEVVPHDEDQSQIIHQEDEYQPLDHDVATIHHVDTSEGVATVAVLDQQTDQQENILVMLENGEVTTINQADAVAMGLTTADGQLYATEGAKIVTEQAVVQQPDDDQHQNYAQDPAVLCPICSDSNSGYHYGIFACESCKGFFKRAIQNNRQLRCNFTGNCDITIATRKRCAACRLRKCLLAGMKVEAIRLDRRRGGRSVYIGPPPLPHFRPQRYIKSSTGLRPYRSDQLLQAETARLLTEVMNLEPQMSEDGEMEPCCEPLLTESDHDPAAAILHLAEHRLYRLIHWARQLPNFSAIETNDQIVLLQNSWANLLALFMCWQSTGSDDLLMNFNKSVSRKLAQALDMEEIFDRIEQMSEFFNTIGLEREEYVAVRLLILVNPDVDMLGDPIKVREHQEQFSEMLLFHTITYRAIESLRYTTILLKIQEIAHIGYLLHEWMLKRYDSYEESSRPQLTGLLVELLKHESVVGGQQAGAMSRLHLPSEPLVEDLVGVPAIEDHQHGTHHTRKSVQHHIIQRAVIQEDVDTSEVVDNLAEEEIVHDDPNVVHVVVDQTHGILVTENE